LSALLKAITNTSASDSFCSRIIVPDALMWASSPWGARKMTFT